MMRNKQLPATSVFSFDSAKSVLMTSIMISPYVVGQPSADQCGPQIVDDLILHAKKGKECATDLNGNDIQAQKRCVLGWLIPSETQPSLDECPNSAVFTRVANSVLMGTGIPSSLAMRTTEPLSASISVGLPASRSCSMDGRCCP